MNEPRKQSDLIKRLQQYLEKNRLSHQRLARRLGVSFVTLNQWLNGHRKLRARECLQIERLLTQKKD